MPGCLFLLSYICFYMAPVSMTEPHARPHGKHTSCRCYKRRVRERMLELSTKAPSAQHGMAIVDEKQRFFWISNWWLCYKNPKIGIAGFTNSDRTMGFRPTLAGERSERGEDSAREAASSVPLPAVFWFVSWWSLISFPFRVFIIWTDPTRKIPDTHILQVQY